MPVPSLILHNCRLFTDGNPFPHRALSIHDGRISAIGSDSDILPTGNATTRVINAGGQWLMPALCDAHTHLSAYAARKVQVDLVGCRSLAEALQRVRAGLNGRKPGEWVVGYGWDKNLWPDNEQPNRQQLDELSRQHLISLQSKDWHSLWVNSPVLQICNILPSTGNPPGGAILREADGHQPSGLLQENACTLVLQHVAPLTWEAIRPALLETFNEYQCLGITAVHSVETPHDFAIYTRLYNNQELGLRIFYYFPGQYLREDNYAGRQRSPEDSFLKICGAKIFTDGTLGSQTADMLQNFTGLEHNGIAVLDPAELADLFQRAAAQGIACAVHAIGDAANRKTLDAFTAIARESRGKDLRHRIEHAQILDPVDIPRFAMQNIIASVQPLHLAADIPLIETYLGARGRYCYAFNSLQQSGTRLIFGSDTPVESFDPWKAIYTALERRYLCNPGKAGFYPEERLTLADCLRAYSSNCAYAVHEEAQLGSIRQGALADLIVLKRDIFAEPSEELLENPVALTIQQGRIVYEDL